VQARSERVRFTHAVTRDLDRLADWAARTGTRLRTSLAEVLAKPSVAGVVLAVGHNRRFLPAFQALQEQLAAGRLGEPLQIEGYCAAPSGHRYTPEIWCADPAESPAGGMTGLGGRRRELSVLTARGARGRRRRGSRR
jgi:predicted dehydrogenase